MDGENKLQPYEHRAQALLLKGLGTRLKQWCHQGVHVDSVHQCIHPLHIYAHFYCNMSQSV